MNASDKVSAALLLNLGDGMDKEAMILGGLYGGIKDNPKAKSRDTMGGILRGAARGVMTNFGGIMGGAAGYGLGAGLGAVTKNPRLSEVIEAIALLSGGAGGIYGGHRLGRRLVGEYGVNNK